MNCEHCQELLHALRADEPAPPELAMHLQTCADCAAVQASLLALGTLLDTELSAAPGLRRQVLARLEQEAAAGKTSTLAGLFMQLWPSRPAGAFSYSLALVLVGMFSGHLLPTNTAAVPAEYQLCPVPEGPPLDTL